MEAKPLNKLDHPLFAIAEGARLLQVRPAKLRSWLEGYKRAGTYYPPVLRESATGREELTWGEFVEAGLLREYRTDIPLQRLRPVIDVLRTEWQVPYPLAHFRPLVDQAARELVFQAQRLAAVEEDLFLVRGSSLKPNAPGLQLQWAAPVAAWLKKIDFDSSGTVTRYRPLATRVTIDPEIEFGIPQIQGVRTETIAEAYATGEELEAIAKTWDLSFEDVNAAIRWEFVAGRAA